MDNNNRLLRMTPNGSRVTNPAVVRRWELIVVGILLFCTVCLTFIVLPATAENWAAIRRFNEDRQRREKEDADRSELLELSRKRILAQHAELLSTQETIRRLMLENLRLVQELNKKLGGKNGL